VRPYVQLSLTIAAIVVAVCAGLFLGGNPKYLPQEFRDIFVEDDRAVRAEIIDAIEDGFYKQVDEDALDQASYKGIVRELDDRFSHYLTPEEADLFSQSVSGRFEGVGMTVQEHPRGLLVATVFEGSPAEQAGIRKDDVITHVNGQSIAGE
jgi:carboxyl-terminal processing protease